MTYVQKQVTVLVCDLCLRHSGGDVVIMQSFQPNEEGPQLDICMTCWGKLRQLFEEEIRGCKIVTEEQAVLESWPPKCKCYAFLGDCHNEGCEFA
jgi:hypothetical protein